MPLLFGVFSRVLPWFVGFGSAVLAVQLGLFKTVILWAFEGILSLVVTVINSFEMDVPQYDPNSLISQLPAEVIGALVDLRVPEAMGIVGAAYGIRLVLQLVPFTRLGS